MSLNGLDDARVKEAHDVAVAEPGGWYVHGRLLLLLLNPPCNSMAGATRSSSPCISSSPLMPFHMSEVVLTVFRTEQVSAQVC